MMTPSARETLVSLQQEIAAASAALKRLERKVNRLADLVDCDEERSTADADFSLDEIERLVCLNTRLAFLERYLHQCDQDICQQMSARVADPGDPVDDFEIEVTLQFMLREDDPEYGDDSDNILTERRLHMKGYAEDPRLEGDWRETIRDFPGRLNEVSHCWLFHDLYDHSYGLDQPALSLRDCLRIDKIWVHVAVDHQATLDLETGEWQPAEWSDS